MRTALAVLVVVVALLALGPQAQAVTVLGYGTSKLLGGDLTDPENDGVDSAENAVGNGLFNAVFRASSEATFSNATSGGPAEAAFDVFDNKVGGGEAKWCCNNAPQWVEADFGSRQFFLTHFTIASDNDSGINRDPDIWQIQGSNDGINYTAIFAYANNGASPFSFGGGSVESKVLLYQAGVDFPLQDTAYSIFRYSVTSSVNGTQHGISELEFFGVPEPATLSLLGLGALALVRRRRRS